MEVGKWNASSEATIIKIAEIIEMQKDELLGIQLRNALCEEVINVFKNGSDNITIVETFQYDANNKLSVKKTASKDSKSKILRDLNIIELMKGLGALQTQTTALIQNNNNQTNSQGGDANKLSEQQLERVKIELTFKTLLVI